MKEEVRAGEREIRVIERDRGGWEWRLVKGKEERGDINMAGLVFHIS